ncbi:NAD(P)-binding domain-containing protein [Verrucosispora sp. WMMD573]|uniref:NAD(P)-dependent oxidoreductase n=1 Tax=Verrucosispora sp. WMMD573 TaxID=3015149 RepID=UPI00248C0BB7|nr:NAD(P)-binding domain-containing protein [Verrucosispora sp. WMMD573]WBB56691.1 NAD(P)-binding domain-containing protein [Verrucosispora sp. WMMD573]
MTVSTTFLGLGAMGSALANAALDAGHRIVAWNRTGHRAHGLGARGATIVDSVEKAVAGRGAVVVCLFDAASVREVLETVATDLAGRIVINLTTTTPEQSRDLARWAGQCGIDLLDGAILAVPETIGGPESVIFYSGSAEGFAQHRLLLDLWGESSYLGPDPGMAALYDTAMLAGMYAMFAGFLHGAAMVSSEGVPAGDFVRRQAPFLAAMTEQLADYAATIDEQDYLGPGQQSLRFTETALATVMRASTRQGVTDEVLRPVHDLVRRQITAGFGEHGTARMFEELRSVR